MRKRAEAQQSRAPHLNPNLSDLALVGTLGQGSLKPLSSAATRQCFLPRHALATTLQAGRRERDGEVAHSVRGVRADAWRSSGQSPCKLCAHVSLLGRRHAPVAGGGVAAEPAVAKDGLDDLCDDLVARAARLDDLAGWGAHVLHAAGVDLAHDHCMRAGRHGGV